VGRRRRSWERAQNKKRLTGTGWGAASVLFGNHFPLLPLFSFGFLPFYYLSLYVICFSFFAFDPFSSPWRPALVKRRWDGWVVWQRQYRIASLAEVEGVGDEQRWQRWWW
jgi:hypothetical protein